MEPAAGSCAEHAARRRSSDRGGACRRRSRTRPRSPAIAVASLAVLIRQVRHLHFARTQRDAHRGRRRRARRSPTSAPPSSEQFARRSRRGVCNERRRAITYWQPVPLEYARRRTLRVRDGEVACAGGRARSTTRPADAAAASRAARRSKPASPARNASAIAFVLLRLARAGRVDQPAAATHDLAPRAAASSTRRRRGRAGLLRDAASGCPDRGASVPRPEHGASTSTHVESAHGKAAASTDPACTMRTFAAPVVATVLRSSVDAPIAHVAGDQQSRATPSSAAIAVVLPPGDAQVSSTREPGRSRGQHARSSCDGFVLRDEQSPSLRAASGCPSSTTNASACEAVPEPDPNVVMSANRAARASVVVRMRFVLSVTGAG